MYCSPNALRRIEMFCARLFSSTKLSGQTFCINSCFVSTWLLFSSSTSSVSKTFGVSGTSRFSLKSRRSAGSTRNTSNEKMRFSGRPIIAGSSAVFQNFLRTLSEVSKYDRPSRPYRTPQQFGITPTLNRPRLFRRCAMNTRGKGKVQHELEEMSKSANRRHAVVLGGSLAGLLAARVLSDYFDRVTLLERDAYPDNTEVRKGIPQANHVHALMLRGRQILEELFPRLQDEMIAAGAPLVDMANDVAWYTRAGWSVRFPSELKVLAFTRPMLDLHVRRRLAQNPKVEICDNVEVLR